MEMSADPADARFSEELVKHLAARGDPGGRQRDFLAEAKLQQESLTALNAAQIVLLLISLCCF